MKNCNDTIGNRTRDLPTCSAVPQPTAPPCALPYLAIGNKIHKQKHNTGEKNRNQLQSFLVRNFEPTKEIEDLLGVRVRWNVMLHA